MQDVQDAAGQKEGKIKGHCYVKLPVFEGPFDLLFHLVHKEELDIHDIPLAKITRQYLHYLQSMQEVQVEIAGEFLVMAASLLQLKSRLLLPQRPSFLDAIEEEGILYFGSKEALVQRLLEYKHFKAAAAVLRERKNRQERIYIRSVVPKRYFSLNHQSRVDSSGLENLKKAWLKLVEKNEQKDRRPEMIFFTPKVSFVRVLRWVVTSLRENTFFNSHLDDFGVAGSTEERVTVFTLFLELARRGRLSLEQAGVFGRIRILKPGHKRGTNLRDAQRNKRASIPESHH